MPVFINGQVNITPVRLSFSREISPEDLLLKLREFIFDAAGERRPGLGSIRDSPAMIGTQRAVTARTPQFENVAERWDITAAIGARFYWWDIDSKLRRTVGAEDLDLARIIRAFDVLFIPLDSGETYLALICSKDPDEFNQQFREQMDAVCEGLGDISYTASRDGAIPGIDNDLVFWLINSWLFSDGRLPHNLEIEDISDARSTLRSAVSRYSQVGHGLDQDRIEFMVMLAQDGQDVTPLKISLRDSARHISYDAELSIDGSFSIRKKSTNTLVPRSEDWTELDDILACTQLFAKQTLPSLVEGRTSDKNWISKGRGALHDRCRERALEILIGELQGAVGTLPGTNICPTCRKLY